jgi:hypothetical protein
MGERAIVLFKDEDSYAPGVYLHWHGDDVPAWLKEAGPSLRAGDAGYAAARFAQFCGNRIEGSLSLGLTAAPTEEEREDWEDYSPGDHGVFVVDCESGKVEQHGEAYGEVKPFTITLGKF